MTLAAFRRARLREAAKSAGIDLLVASLPQNIAYLADGYISVNQGVMNRSTCFVALNLATDRLAFVVSYSEVPTVLEHAGFDVDLYTYGTFLFSKAEDEKNELSARLVSEKQKCFVDLPTAFAAMVRDQKAKAVALDEERISVSDWNRISKALPEEVSLTSGTDLFMKARFIKHKDEIAGLERAARVAEDCLSTALREYARGMTEKDLAHIYAVEAVKAGAVPYFFVGTAGLRAAYSDTVNTDYVIREGDMIRFDFGVQIGGFCSDLARTAVVGEPSEKLVNYYAAVKAGTEEAIKLVKPGVKAETLFDVAVAVTKEKGIRHYERHHVGHGIGIETYDYPTLAPGVTTLLEPDMVINIETPYYEPGWGGVQIENTIAVTNDGYRVLDISTTELIRV